MDVRSTKSADLIGHIKFLPEGQLDGCSVTRLFLSLRRVWLARLMHAPPDPLAGEDGAVLIAGRGAMVKEALHIQMRKQGGTILTNL